MDAKVWYLANGDKKVGPLTAQRILERVAQGRVPARARAWREGLAEWRPLAEIEELQVLPTLVDARRAAPADGDQAVPAPAFAPEALAAPGRRARPAKVARRAERAVGSTPAAPVVAEGPFDPPCRLERRDVWAAFGAGLAPRRVGLALAGLVAAGAAAGLLLGVGALATKAHLLLGAPFALAAAVAAFAALALGRGALAYDARRRLEERDPPAVREAFAHALAHAPSHLVPPLALAVAFLVPAAALAVLGLLLRVPVVGPLGTGLLFGVHLGLGALVLYLLVVGASATTFGPAVVAFEGHGLLGTLRALVAWPRQGLVRALLAGLLPGLAFGPFAVAVLAAGAVALALPVGVVALTVGRDVAAWFQSLGALEPVALPTGLGAGLAAMTLWVGLFVAVLAAVLASVGSALGAAAYAVGRPGNEGRVSRDTWLARRAAAAEAVAGEAR